MLIYLACGEHQIVTEMDAQNKVKMGDEMEVVIKMHKTHIFDLKTGKALI